MIFGWRKIVWSTSDHSLKRSWEESANMIQESTIFDTFADSLMDHEEPKGF